MSGNEPGKNLTATEIRYHLSRWHDYIHRCRLGLDPEPPRKRMGNRHDARSAPKKIKQWRDQWALIKARDARRYRDGNVGG